MTIIASNPRLFQTTALTAVLTVAFGTAVAQTPEQAQVDMTAENTTVLRTIKVEASTEPGVTPGKITSTTKGDARPLETPQSITVLTRELLDSRQDKSLVEALASVAGVVAGERGRRGFDDFGIRGQVFGQEKYIDGLNTVRSGYVPAEEIFGAERIEVLKGPASVLFGSVRPGGLVNIVSKRPTQQAFSAIGVTVGNYDFKEGTIDMGHPLSEDGRAAFRVNGVINDSEDETDFVFFKNRYLAPSLMFGLGHNTAIMVLTSYQEREWQRNQGLAPKGTVLPNINGPIQRSLFIGEPSFGTNDSTRVRVGYELDHRFASGWTLQQNFRWEDYELNQHPSAFHGTLAANERTQSRTGNIQHDDYRALALDTYVGGSIPSAIGIHELTIGLDLNDKDGRLSSQACTSADLGTIDLFNPVYGVSTTCTGSRADNTQDIRAAGLYARDRLHIDQRLHLTFGARHDRITTDTTDNLGGSKDEPKDSATTGMVGLVYEVQPGIAPYISWANSFVPVSGVDRDGEVFEPETGKQIEAGVKFERDGGRQVAAIAVYDLRRSNVLTPDPVNAAFNVQDGEHHSKGAELELAADLSSGFSLTGAYAYTDAVVSKSNMAGQAGRTVDNVPKHSVSAWGMYHVPAGLLSGWSVGLGLRHMSERTGYSYDFTIPDYTVFDAAVHYQSQSFRVALNVRNLTDRTYYGGALGNNVVTLGDTRQIRLSVVYQL